MIVSFRSPKSPLREEDEPKEAEGGGGLRIPATHNRTQVHTRLAQSRTQLHTQLREIPAADQPPRDSHSSYAELDISS